jgi:heme/copper-type cytochrome/quinol oxidase subunit 1
MTAIPLPLETHPVGHHDGGPRRRRGHAHDHAHPPLSFVKKYLFSTDHKVIGLQFLFMGLFFLVVGGALAMVVRWQLAWPNERSPGFKPVPGAGPVQGWTQGVMPQDFYNGAFSMHASIMIFLVIIPLLVGTFGNYLIPLKIGAPDMSFPFLNGAAFWLAVPAGVLLTSSFFFDGGAAGAGWTSYPPLSTLWNPGAAPINSQNRLEWVKPIGDVTPYAWIAATLRWESPPAGAVTPFQWLVNVLTLHGVRPDGKLSISTWKPAAVVMNFAALALMFLYFAAYHVRLGWRPLNWVVGLALSLAGAYGGVKLFQFLAFDGQAAWFLAIFLIGFSSIMGAINYLTTIVKLRAPGMTFFRMPLSVWSLFVTSLIVLLATPVLAATVFMNLLDHHRWTTFFLPFNWTVSQRLQHDVAGGGYPILHQHLFWFYSHPAVYIMILPAMGMVSDVISVFSRKPIFGYKPMIYAMGAIAFLGFIVWAHHMFQSGMNPTLGTTFAVSTMFIAVPSAIKTFNWLGTIWRGNIQFTTPMLHA